MWVELIGAYLSLGCLFGYGLVAFTNHNIILEKSDGFKLAVLFFVLSALWPIGLPLFLFYIGLAYNIKQDE